MRNLSPLHTAPAFVGPHRQLGGGSQPVEQKGNEVSKGLVGAAGLAALTGMSLAPQVAQAANVGKAVVKANPDLADVFTKSSTQVGDYTLHFRPADINVTPRLSGMTPGLRVRGEFLDAELSKTESLGEGWSRTQGLRGRIHGDISTYGDVNSSLNLEGFKRWEGSFKPGLYAKFEVSGGAYQDLIHNTTSVGVQAYQELKGGNFTFHDQPLSWHVEGRQHVGQRVAGSNADQPSTQYGYSFLVGVRRDYPMKVFGRSAVVSAIVGPDLHGNQDKKFEVSPKVKMRVQFQ
ncbi:MAG: hypothetical protein J0I12_12755 [Candidatus Eremiobacteraeota bacterium]|nr:hypothetical protein [Candidatus Eremiobacteraeota bacterium]